MQPTHLQTAETLAYSSVGDDATPIQNLLKAAQFAARVCIFTVALPLGIFLVSRYRAGLPSQDIAASIVQQSTYWFAALTAATFGYLYVPADTRQHWIDVIKVFGLILAITLGVLLVLLVLFLIVAWYTID